MRKFCAKCVSFPFCVFIRVHSHSIQFNTKSFYLFTEEESLLHQRNVTKVIPGHLFCNLWAQCVYSTNTSINITFRTKKKVFQMQLIMEVSKLMNGLVCIV